VFAYDRDLFSVIHLMIAGRLHWADAGRKPPGRKPLLEFQFSTGKLTLTEAGSKRRASLHLVRGEDALAAHDPGGIEPLESDAAAFARALRSANHTVKRALTDPHLLSGIGNAYSDEILHRARLSPIALTQKLGDAELEHLFRSDPGRAPRVDRAAARAGGRRLPRGGDRVPPRDGGARPASPAVPGVRLAGTAHRARRERDQLLRALPDRRAPARGRALSRL
jgi:formamidopyrimidine-DNA glycosylase